jgi:hypothetical protein
MAPILNRGEWRVNNAAITFPAVQRHIAIGSVALFLALSCSRAPEPEEAPAPVQQQPLAGYAALRIVVVPAGHVRAPDSLSWVARLGGARATARRLDTLVQRALEIRGLASRWVLPAELTRAYERNRSYAADPYQLVWTPVRSPRFKVGERYGEPLSSQLRTMIALQDDVRYVLLPIELRFERDTGALGHAVLRAALVDARTTEARWVADVKGNPTTDASAALASAADKLADLFAAP